jgi:thiamine phosphate synthase YjbQ (UPF0047 family)
MPAEPLQLTLALTPRARLDVIDVREHVSRTCEGLLREYPRALYCSLHTTAGYLEQSFAARLAAGRSGVGPYIDVFRTMFPEGAGYEHDELDRRTDLSTAQRQVEPRNADSHLAFIMAGLRSCVSYVNARVGPVCFIDLDGVHGTQPRRRVTSVLGYTREEQVARVRLRVPVSSHPVESVNLKSAQLGIYEQVSELIAAHGVAKGRVRLDLAPGERHAGVTVNEYETLLMRHDLAEVLRNPLGFMAEKGRNLLADPRSIPTKTLDYAKYDLVRAFNQLIEALGLHESMVEQLLSRALALPAARFLRMKRSVSLMVSDAAEPGRGALVEGTYQSPILVQWRRADRDARRLDLTLTRFV